MSYLGGKFRLAKDLSAIINKYAHSNELKIVEPFCGFLEVTKFLDGDVDASDIFQPLITLYNSMLNGWVPPEVVTVDEYHKYKKEKDPLDPMTAFVGFGCSFGGKYFKGFAKNKNNFNYAEATKKNLEKKIESCKGRVSFKCSDYKDLNPINKVVYCDPPYFNTTGYINVGKFDSDEFWSIADQWSKNNIVIVSELVAPLGWNCIWEEKCLVSLRKEENYKSRKEKLFIKGC